MEQSCLSIDVNFNENSLENVTNFKLLGITLDQDVAFNHQIEELKKKWVRNAYLGLMLGLTPFGPYGIW